MTIQNPVGSVPTPNTSLNTPLGRSYPGASMPGIPDSRTEPEPKPISPMIGNRINTTA
ncbi:hypothetical protein [Paraburkholderia sp.]|uniref:hypothetical protein n=1 Tax=Paraburkholderia sp. TaxID=1926495 RepID=UPI00239F36AD|nr:hypothetical protein [Paraburkholderia sp.]MDE1180686.1 hypothetical protein [Paraburkholderia sp.]